VTPSRSGPGFGADAGGTVWEVGLMTLPAGVAQEQGSTVYPLIALVVKAGGDCHLNDDYRALIADGVLRDIRNLPIEVQLQAAAKGPIPDLPALVSSDQSGKLR